MSINASGSSILLLATLPATLPLPPLLTNENTEFSTLDYIWVIEDSIFDMLFQYFNYLVLILIQL